MENKKEKMHPFFKLLVILFIIFIAYYIALESGYYPSKLQKDTLLTNEEIKKFETDLDNNKMISTSGYMKKEVNYSNIFTKAGNGLTYSLGKVLTKGSKEISSLLKYLFG